MQIKYLFKNILFGLMFLAVPVSGYAGHILGGVLNYEHNGGNIYTIRLKLYRDCIPNSSAFPANITISIRGANGATFSPSKDLTMSLGSAVTVPNIVNPCGVSPNPVPCVQEGIYTQTISLPPVTGGYHLYYQAAPRSTALTNINASCNCIGASFYAHIPTNIPNSNPVFSSYPPLYFCLNQPFSFSYGATDANGDVLVYSLYTPYNGDNGSGPLDPVISGNTASFTPVSYNTGYTTNNPLGASPFTINPATGVITGTPGTVGTFVVGIRVREYRNGQLISETIRDFPFTVLSCPQPPPTLAIPDQTLNFGCQKELVAQGLSAAQSTWKSVSPGALGAYNNYLSCTSTCLKPKIAYTGTATAPPVVKYVVCGNATSCQGGYVCDTFLVTFNPPLTVSIMPSNPALCNGQTSTTLIAIASGGTPPYSYLWNNVNPSQTITVGAGTYNVKVTDASGCAPAFNSKAVISYSVPVTVNAGPDKTRCIANPAASLSATVTGATGALWSGGTGTFSPNNNTTSNLFYTPSPAELTNGSATLFVTTTGNGLCPAATDTIVIFYTGFTGTVVPSATMVSCYGGNNGKASFSVTGGMNPHTFFWNTVPSQTSATAGSLTAGNYSVTITNSLGCITQQTITVSQPLPLAFGSTVSNVSCFGGANGALTVTASGGTAPFTYSWMPGGQTSASINSLTAGSYTCIIRDVNTCTLAVPLQVTQPASLAITLSQTNAACFNTATGAINTTLTGGTPPYSYSWSPNGASAPNLTSLFAGTYTLNAKDNLNCTISRTVTITQPPLLTIAASFSNETCSYLNNGSAQANAVGGTPGYTYNWVPGSFSSAAVSSLQAGTYTVTVTDAGGCGASTMVTVSEPPILSVSFINQNNISCFGGNNASVTANASGGTPGYSYSWSPGSVTTASLVNIPVGTYTIQVTDTQSCIASGTVGITEPPAMSFTAATTSVTCYGGSNGSAGVTVGGGTTPYAYFWLPGGQITPSVTALSAGTYTSIITDANGCVLTVTQTVIQATSLSIVFTASNVSCFNGSDGAANAAVSGGTPPYAYSWSPSGNTQSITGLSAGVYSLTVTDFFNCQTSGTVAITEPTPLAITASFTNETCDYLDNGSASATVTGGTPGYSYLWQPGGAGTPTISGLSAGSYSVTVTDLNGCIINTVVSISQPLSLSVSALSITPVSCFGGNDGSTNVQATGGTPNYSFTWTPGGSNSTSFNNLSAGIYTITVSDSYSCLAQSTIAITEPAQLTISDTTGHVWCNGGSNGFVNLTPAGGTIPYTYFWLPSGLTTSTLGGLSAGIYTAIVTDANACTATSVYIVTEPTPLMIAFTTTAVSCFQGSDGSANAAVSGGYIPYTFNWSNSATTQNLNGLAAGVYTLTVTDSLNCIASATVEITEPALLTLSATHTDESCDYADDGSASVFASGGTPGYTFLWQPGAVAGSSISALQSGSYSVTATDQLGCTATTVVVISEPAALNVSFSNSIHVSCNGGNNGSATALGTGGTPNYSYTWSPGGSNSAMITGLIAGSYTVAVTDNNGCTAQNTITLIEPPPFSLITTISNVVCNGGSNGAVSVSSSGGTAPYSHMIMPGNIPGVNFSGLLPGTYSIITTDAGNCIYTTTIAITQPVNMSTAVGFTNATCGLQNGVATISVTNGGAPPFTYNWLPSGGTGSISTALFAGSYTVEVTDSLGCVTKRIVNISNLSAPLLSIVSATNVSCYGGADGALTATHSPGAAPFSYSWTPTGGTSLTATGLTSGVYVLELTDNFGCKSYVTSTLVTQPDSITIAVSPVNVDCFGGTDGSASASVSGGVPTYTYNWQSGVATGSTVTGLSAGSYSILVTDGNNCVQTTTFAVSQPAAPLSLSLSSVPVSCAGGTNGAVTATAAGGTSPYNYQYQPGNFSGPGISNVAAGIFTVTATDMKACVTTETIAVTEPLPMSLLTGDTDSDCSGANGQASVTASGGSGGYTYLWAPSGGTNAIATGLTAGNYTVTVTDSNNCTAVTTQSVSDNPSPLVSVLQVTNVSCFNGSDGAATASVTGGTGPFTFVWTPVGGNSITATGLSIGSYTVLVTSFNNCTVTAVSPVITQPPQIFINTSTLAVSCFGGSDGRATANVFGGTPGYTYTWQSGTANNNSVSALSAGNYSLEVNDANNCIRTATFHIPQPAAPLNLSLSSTSVSCSGGSNGSVSCSSSGGTGPYTYTLMPGNFSGPGIANLGPGIYTVTASDVKGCVTQETVSVDDAPGIVLSTGSMNSNCSLANGQASVSASGGTGSFTYLWNPAGGTASVATGISAGIYTVTVTDSNSCTAIATETVTDLPAHVVAINSVTNVSCFGGSDGAALATVTGGTGPFSYSWSPAGGSTVTATGLATGTYTVLVTSANGCTVSATSPPVTQPPPLVVNLSTSHVSCFGGNNGSASASAFGGTGTYSYSWQSGVASGSLNTGLFAGTYTMQVSDGNSCATTNSFSITQPAASLGLTITSTPVSCFGGANGTAQGITAGGTAPYSYNWSPYGGTAAQATGFSAGIFTLTAYDNKACVTSETVEITQPPLPVSVTATVTDVSCFGGSNGSATVTAAGGTPGYSYSWTPSGGTAQTAAGFSKGIYFVTVTDNNSCMASLSVSVNEPSQLTASLITVDPSCGLPNGSISSQVSGGTGPYTYSWNPGASTNSYIDSLFQGTYTLQVSDAAACVHVVSATLTNIPGPIASISGTQHVSCFGGNNGASTVTISQGTLPYAVNWSPYGGNSVNGTSLVAGTYSAVVTDSLGCVATATVLITEPLQVSVLTDTIIHVSCHGLSDGAITVHASGGTPGYSYAWSNTKTGNMVNQLPAGSYVVTALDTNNCSGGVSIIVTEPSPLTSTIAVSNALCHSGPGSASVTVAGGTSPYSYLWSPNTGQNGNVLNEVPAGNYTVDITDGRGCTKSNSVQITQPPQVVTSVSQADTLCAGKQSTLTASASGGSGGYYYSWMPSATTNSGTLIFSAQNITYTVLAFDKNGCSGLDATSEVNVYDLTASDLEGHGHSPICPGQSSLLEATTSGNTGPLTFSWNNNLPPHRGLHAVAPVKSTTYIVTATNACGKSVSDSIFIILSTPPVVKLSADTLRTCIPGVINFRDMSGSANEADPIVAWSWNFGDGTSAPEQHPSHLFQNQGTFSVNLTVTSDRGCTNKNAVPIVIGTYPQPVAAFSLNSTSLELPYDMLKCTNQSTGAVSYNWNFGNEAQSTLSDPQILLKSVGTIEIQLVATSQFGCRDTATKIVITNADVIFPNAFTPNEEGSPGGYYSISALNNDIFFPYTSGVLDYHLQVFSRWGELIFESKDINLGWDGYYRGEICQLGVYVWKADIKLENGKTFNRSGTVTLLR